MKESTEYEGGVQAMKWADWLPGILVGVVFTSVACLKFYGLRRGIEGGRGKPFPQRLCGT
jgi:hypothetical protein